LASFAALTVVSSYAYYLLSRNLPGQGLVSSCATVRATYLDALYFSIATETTVGYGDLSPAGYSRLVACLQVVGGLVLAGMTVSKLSSGAGGRLKSVVSRCCGEWIELNYLSDDVLLISLAIISYGDGTLRYEGDNYDKNGVLQGSFKGTLVAKDDHVLVFRYSNRDSAIKHFDDGHAQVNFLHCPFSRKYMEYAGKAVDSGHGTILYDGYRASEEESKIIHGVDLDARGALAKARADKYFEAHAAVDADLNLSR
jgi:hypothetical protein